MDYSVACTSTEERVANDLLTKLQARGGELNHAEAFCSTLTIAQKNSLRILLLNQRNTDSLTKALGIWRCKQYVENQKNV